MASGNTDAALRSLTEAITLDPNFEDAILLRDDINIAKGDLATAIASLTQVITRRPHRVNAHLLLAAAYLKQKFRPGAGGLPSDKRTVSAGSAAAVFDLPRKSGHRVMRLLPLPALG
jgi:tetratricopeptide (TPR) repeat protein